MWCPNCLPISFPLFPSCLSDDVVCHLSPSCLVFVLQIWSSNYLPVCSKCIQMCSPDSLSVVFHLTSSRICTCCRPPMISQLLSNCFRASSQTWSSNRRPISSLHLEIETITAGCKAGLSVSGSPDVFFCMLVSVSLCLPLCRTVSDSRISFVAVLVSGFPFRCLLSRCLSSLPFIRFPLWPVVSSILASVIWLYGCLSLRVFLHVSPTMARGVRLSGCLLFAFTSLPSFVSYHLPPNSFVFHCLPTHLSSVLNSPLLV